MKVDIARHVRGFTYRLSFDPDDPRDFAQANNPSRRFTRVGDEFTVELPAAFSSIHPDLHAAAIWLALRPMVGAELTLPFGVSAAFAEAMHESAGVRLPHVDAAAVARTCPERPRPALLFSGGVDSLAAMVVMPRDTVLLFMDRLPHPPAHGEPANDGPLVELRQQRGLCGQIARRGGDVQATRDDHDHLYEPYPFYHSSVFHLPALYLAESLGLGPVATGDVLCAVALGGYHTGATGWRFHSPLGRAGTGNAAVGPTSPELPFTGLELVQPILGLTEIGSALVVERSAFKGRATSCYFPSNSNYCLRCDKCFKKLLLTYVFDDREVPADLLEHFLCFPHLADIFRRPFFDWHHVWYYLFQRLRCRHPLAQELHRQALAGPDLSLLEKWYPAAEAAIPAAYRGEVVERIQRHVAPMSRDEQARLEQLDVPPLVVPAELLRPRPGRTVSAGPARSDHPREVDSLPEGLSPAGIAAHLDRLLPLHAGAVDPAGGSRWRTRAAERPGLIAATLGARGECGVSFLERHDRAAGATAYHAFCTRLPRANRAEWRRLLRLAAAALDSRCWAGTEWLQEDRLRELMDGTPLLRRVELAVLAAGGSARPTPFTASWPVAGGDGTVLVSLHDGSSFVDLSLADLTVGERCFLATRQTAISHSQETPLDSERKLAATRHFGRCLEAVELTPQEGG